MNEETKHRIHPVTIALLVAGVLTLALGIAVGIAYMSRPTPITLEISEPKGSTVLCDLVIDGKPESRRATAPVNYVFEARKVDFAVIPQSADDGYVQVKLTAKFGGGNAMGDGVRGSTHQSGGGGGISIGPMTMPHVENMRKSRVDEPTAPMPPSDPAVGEEGAPSGSGT